jgi:hypothetical protein
MQEGYFLQQHDLQRPAGQEQALESHSRHEIEVVSHQHPAEELQMHGEMC